MVFLKHWKHFIADNYHIFVSLLNLCAKQESANTETL